VLRFYTAADWQGIHTIMLSCVIVAQPGLGATLQKTWLRIGGALLAPAGAANDRLYSAAYRLARRPAGDDPAGDGAGGWIAAGSERIAYAGIQIGFTFSLAFLSWFGPLQLTELRDRVIGILLGVLVSSIVHLYLWPDSEARSSNRGWRPLPPDCDDLRASRDEVQLVPLFHALNRAETLIIGWRLNR
jgi:multidrug resistance protein MdtO